jgi:FixJ family two-component response regulator
MSSAEQTVFIVDDDEAVRDALKMLLCAAHLQVKTFASAAAFLKEYRSGDGGCIVLDVRMPGMSGLELQDELYKRRIHVPIVFLTGHADVPMAVRALKKGAHDFIEKPLDSQRLVLAVLNALRFEVTQRSQPVSQGEAPQAVDARLEALSEREREVLDLVLKGRQTRAISDELCISVKTVEFHRARIREKLGVNSLAELFGLFRQA